MSTIGRLFTGQRFHGNIVRKFPDRPHAELCQLSIIERKKKNKCQAKSIKSQLSTNKARVKLNILIISFFKYFGINMQNGLLLFHRKCQRK